MCFAFWFLVIVPVIKPKINRRFFWAVFLCLDAATFMLGQMTCCGELSYILVLRRIFNRIPCPCHCVPVIHPPQLWQTKVSPDIIHYPEGMKSPCSENHSSWNSNSFSSCLLGPRRQKMMITFPGLSLDRILCETQNMAVNIHQKAPDKWLFWQAQSLRYLFCFVFHSSHTISAFIPLQKKKKHY